MTHVTATDANFAEVTNTGKPVLIDFWATWCGPCRQVAPIIEAIGATREDVTVVKVDIDEAPATAQKFGVMSVPTLVVLSPDGSVVNSRAGAQPRPVIDAMLDAAA